MQITKNSKGKFKANDFVVVKDTTAKHNFTLCLVKDKVDENTREVEVVYLMRDIDKSVRSFVSLKDQKIKTVSILFKAKHVVVTEPESTRKSKPMSSKKIEITTSEENYNQWKAKVKQILKNEEPKTISEDAGDDVIEDEEDDIPLGRVKVDRDSLVGKLSKSKKKNAKPRGTFDSEDEVFQSEEEMDESGVKVKVRKIKTAKGKVKKAPKVVVQPTYKKGAFNRNVVVVDNSQQYDSTQTVFDTDCCVFCNSKELYRAAHNNNGELVDIILKDTEKLVALNLPPGPKSLKFPITEALKHHNLAVVADLLKADKDRRVLSNKSTGIHFTFVGTGSNDKYAYGVATREVDMARGNREGTNAFLYDSNGLSRRISHDGAAMSLICKGITDQETYLRLVGLHPDFGRDLFNNFYRVVENGNLELAKLIAKDFNANQGYGFNDFHSLALNAVSVDELGKLMKVNCRKKASMTRQMTPTHLACLNPNPDILRKFLDVGEELFIVDEYLRKPVHYAALSPHTGPLQVLLDRGVDCRDYDKNKWTPLMFAAVANRPANMTLMCNKVVYNLNMKNKEGNAAIHVAVENMSVEALKELIRLGADKNLTGKNKRTPLVIACEVDCFEIVQFLVESGVKMHTTDKYGKSALLHAVVSGNIKTVTYLLSRGADFKKHDSSGNGALHYACAYGHYELIDHLIRAGVSINAVNNWNLSPILVALMKNHPRCLKIMVNYPEIDVNCQDKNGFSLIDNCAHQFTDISLEFCEFLIRDKKANVNVVDFSGNTVFHRLAMNPVRKDMELNSLKDAKDKFKADHERFSRFFALFCDAGIDRNLRNLAGYSSIEIAVLESNWQFVDLALKSKGFDISAVNFDNQLILHYITDIFFSQKHFPLLMTILSTMDKRINFEKIYDSNGFNFFHSLLDGFLTRMRYEKYNQYSANKTDFYQRYQKKAVDNSNVEETKLIDTKMTKLSAKIAKKESQALNNFLSFVKFLDSINFNIFDKIAVFQVPAKKYIEDLRRRKDKQTKKANSFKKVWNSQGSRPAKRVKAGAGGETEEDEDPKDDEMFEFAVNDFAQATTLHLAMQYPLRQVLDLLISVGIKNKSYVSNEKSYFGSTLFNEYVARGSNIAGVASLLSHIGENPNTPNEDGDPPFLLMCRALSTSSSPESEIVKLLEEFVSVKSLNIDATNAQKETAFLIFAKQRRVGLCRLLLDKGANPHISDQNNRNALHWAINNNVAEDTNFDFEEFLISKKVDCNQLDARNRGPIHYFFVKIGSPFLNSKKEPIDLFADFLSNKNINIDVADEFGNTPLCYAAQRGAALSFGMLIKRKANINHRNKIGNTPLSIALINDHSEIASYCIQQNCSINIDAVIQSTGAVSAWNQTKEEYQTVKRKEELFMSQPSQRLVKFSLVESFTQGRIQGLKLIRKFEEKTDKVFELDKVKAKAVASLSVNELRFWEKEKFVDSVKSVFKLSLQKKFDSVNYLLLDFGANLGSTIVDSLESKLINYSIKMLKKRPDENNPRFFDQFRFKNSHGQTIAHVFAKNASGLDETNSNVFIDLMLQKGIEIDSKDDKGVTPLLYLAHQFSNLNVLKHFLSKKVDTGTLDKQGNWMVSVLLQNKTVTNLVKMSKTIDNSSKGIEQKRSKFGSKRPVKTRLMRGQPAATPSFNPGNAFNLSGFQSFPNNSFESFVPSFAPSGNTSKNFPVFTPSFAQFTNTESFESNEEVLASLIKDPKTTMMEFIEECLKKDQKFINNEFGLFESKRAKIKHYTLLKYALKKLSNLSLARLIIENGGDINAANKKGHTIITWAIKNNNMRIVDFLMDFKSKIDFNHVDLERNSYVHHIVSPMKCASYENTKLLEYFGNKVNSNSLNADRKPPVYYAMTQESGIMLRKLEAMGVQPYKDTKVVKSTPFLSKVPFYENEFDFEEDFKLAVKRAQDLLKSKEVEVEEPPKPNSLVVGEVELVRDAQNEFYDVVLVKVDIKYGYYSENVFYLMQICFDRLRKILILFTSWGRIGTVGQYQQTPFFTLDDCLKEFNKIFKEKTGNEYSARHDFVKKDKKYRLLKTKHKVLKNILVNLFDPVLDKTVPSKISNSLFKLMSQITDSKMIQVAYSREAKVDVDLMPFGTLSNECIKKAKGLLLDIIAMAENIEKNNKKMKPKDLFELANEVAEKTSEYYEMIPTVNNRTGPISALTVQTGNNEILRLYNIENLEIISRLLSAAVFRMNKVHPYDYCLKSLSIKIDRLPSNSEEYLLIQRYMNSESKVKREFKLVNVYAVERMGEDEKIKKWTVFRNNRLLWHGTRTENCLGILHQGLRVSPPDVVRNGQRLGNGIYFSERFGYAANFSYGYGSNANRFTFLCEVALGKMQKVYASNDLKPNSGEFHSVKGIGSHRSDKNQCIFLGNGTRVACGKFYKKYEKPPVEGKHWFQFEQNEFVVGDKGQVKLRYLIEFKNDDGFVDDVEEEEEGVADDEEKFHSAFDDEDDSNED